MLPQLFKRTAKGAVQVWDIELEHGTGRYRMISGQLGGKMVVSEWTQAKPKNAGRANATTAQQQALIEVKAAWEKKRRDGYSETIEAANKSKAFQCMLATNYVTDKLRRRQALAAAKKGQLWSQPKLDGIRCLSMGSGLLTRKNRPILAAPHIHAALREVHSAYPGSVVDGELFNFDLRDDFNEIVSMCRRTARLTAADLEKSARMTQFWVYDCVGLGLPRDAVYEERYVQILKVIGGLSHPMVHVLSADLVTSEEEIDSFYEQYLGFGDEGQILRINGPYENKRSGLLQKRKDHEDEEFVVVDIEEGDGNRSGQAGRVFVRDKKSGVQSRANVKGDKAFRVQLLREKAKYIGGECTVRFNGRTPDGVPRFPRVLADGWWPGGRDL